MEEHRPRAERPRAGVGRADQGKLPVLDPTGRLTPHQLDRRIDAFDEEFARVRGVRVSLFYLLLLCLTAVTVVILVRIVGIIMVIALLTLPSAIASKLGRGFFQIMLIATLLCMLFISSGLAISYSTETVTGPTIILIAAGTYLISLFFTRSKKKNI